MKFISKIIILCSIVYQANAIVKSWALCWETQQCTVPGDECCYARPPALVDKYKGKKKVMVCGHIPYTKVPVGIYKDYSFSCPAVATTNGIMVVSSMVGLALTIGISMV